MRAVEYFKRMFEIFFIFAFGLMEKPSHKRIESGYIPLKLTMGKDN